MISMSLKKKMLNTLFLVKIKFITHKIIVKVDEFRILVFI